MLFHYIVIVVVVFVVHRVQFLRLFFAMHTFFIAGLREVLP